MISFPNRVHRRQNDPPQKVTFDYSLGSIEDYDLTQSRPFGDTRSVVFE